ncbi:hypothetical protein [Nocardia sp. NPDC049526]|uniref:hypothetical protein n=1 Tax=Nocardia sp. NPDC049526 TaxID=3364316 RepID=UPI0037900B36
MWTLVRGVRAALHPLARRLSADQAWRFAYLVAVEAAVAAWIGGDCQQTKWTVVLLLSTLLSVNTVDEVFDQADPV